MYKRLRNEFTGVFTGRAPLGGSVIRPEATGYGAVISGEMLRDASRKSQGKTAPYFWKR